MGSRGGDKFRYVGWCAPGSRSHSSLETNGHGSVHCSPKVWLLSNWSYLRTTCSFHAALVSSQSQLTWVPNFTPSLSSPSYSTLSSFAQPASPHSVLFMYPFHIHCFSVPASSSPSLSQTTVSVPCIPDFIIPTQFPVSSSLCPLPANWLYPITCTHSPFPLAY